MKLQVMAEIDKIDWSRYMHSETGDCLKTLFCGDKEAILTATHRMWCTLCHQYAYVTDAALPAYDFLKYALLNLDEYIKIEILDILNGFAICTSSHIQIVTSWKHQLRQKMINDYGMFQKLASDCNEDISGFAEGICEYLNESARSDKDLKILVEILTAWVGDNNLKGKKVLEFTWGGTCKDILTGLGCEYHERLLAYHNYQINGTYDAALNITGAADFMPMGASKSEAPLKSIYNCLQSGASMLFLRHSHNKISDNDTNIDALMAATWAALEHENTDDACTSALQAVGFTLDKLAPYKLQGRAYSGCTAIYARK